MNEKEYKLIDIISDNNNTSQREMSKAAGVSLGMVNILLRNLVKKGYVKVSQLNSKKTAYILTAKGFQEKARKTFNYMRRIVSEMNNMKAKIKTFILNEHKKGVKTFFLIDSGEIYSLFELSARELNLSDINIQKGSSKLSDEKSVAIYCGELKGDLAGALHISSIVK